MKNGKIPDTVVFCIGKGNLIFVSANISQNAIYKSGQVSPAPGGCLFYSLIDGSRFRYPVHKEYLIKGKTKDIQD
jgi:hypothetical protein